MQEFFGHTISCFQTNFIVAKGSFLMNEPTYTHQDLLRAAKLTPTDTEEIFKCRRSYNRLGFAYQLAFVRLHNRFPTQQPFEIDQELLTYAGMQTDIPITEIEDYVRRQPTLSEHQERIRVYLQLHRLDDDAMEVLEQFLFDEACRLENTGPLMALAKQFLKTNRILQPTDDMLRRLIVRQRQAARQHIFYRISESLSSEVTTQLGALLAASDTRYTPLQMLKRPPGRASPTAMLRLLEKLDVIQVIGILAIDLSWLNNNYQRSLSRYASRCSAKRLRKLQVARRYTVLTCFLHQTYRDTIDHAIDMYGKLLTGVYYRAQTSIDKETRRQRQITHNILGTFKTLGEVLLDESVNDQELRKTMFDHVDRGTLVSQMNAVDIWLSGKYSHPFNLVVQRHSYLRQFAPTFLAHLEFHQEEGVHSPVIEAIQLLQELDDQNKRKLPEDAPLGFLSRTLRPLVVQNGTINKRAWECALLTAIRDEVKSGNLYVHQSKRFGRFENFFISKAQW